MNDTIRKCLMRGTAILAFSMIAYNASAITSGPVNPDDMYNPGGGTIAGGGASVVDQGEMVRINEDAMKLIASTVTAEKVIEPSVIESIKNKLYNDSAFYTKLETFTVKPTIELYRGELGVLSSHVNNNMVTNAKLNTLVDVKLSEKFDEYLKNPNISTVRCAVPPSCADIGFTKTAADCAGKAMLKCPLNQSKVYCGGEATPAVNVCTGSLVEKTFSGRKYCCPIFASTVAPMKNCVLQTADPTIQGLYESNYVLLKNLELAQADLVEFKKLDYNGLKTFATYKDKYLALKDMSSSNITALKSEVSVAGLENSISSLSSTTDKLSRAACGDTSAMVCVQKPGGGSFVRP